MDYKYFISFTNDDNAMMRYKNPFDEKHKKNIERVMRLLFGDSLVFIAFNESLKLYPLTRIRSIQIVYSSENKNRRKEHTAISLIVNYYDARLDFHWVYKLLSLTERMLVVRFIRFHRLEPRLDEKGTPIIMLIR